MGRTAKEGGQEVVGPALWGDAPSTPEPVRPITMSSWLPLERGRVGPDPTANPPNGMTIGAAGGPPEPNQPVDRDVERASGSRTISIEA